MNNSKKFGIQHYVDMLERDGWSREKAEGALASGFDKAAHEKRMRKASKSKDNPYPTCAWHGRFNRVNFKIAFDHIFNDQPLPVMEVTSKRIQSKRDEAEWLETQNEELRLTKRIAAAKAERAEQEAIVRAEREAKLKLADEEEVEAEVVEEAEVEEDA